MFIGVPVLAGLYFIRLAIVFCECVFFPIDLCCLERELMKPVFLECKLCFEFFFLDSNRFLYSIKFIHGLLMHVPEHF